MQSEMMTQFLCGWVGGAAGCMASYPLDTVKTLMQHDTRRYPTAAVTLREVYRGGGVAAFYRGCVIPVSMVGVLYALNFFSYNLFLVLIMGPPRGVQERQTAVEEAVVALVPEPPRKSALTPIPVVAVCGGLSGVVNSFVQGPGELLKIRQQVASSAGEDHRLLSVARQILVHEGPRGLTRGLLACIVRDLPGTVAWFSTYELVKRGISLTPETPRAAESLLAGGAAGLAPAVLVYPADVVKTLVQSDTRTGAHKQTMRLAARSLYQRGGLAAFYKGVGAQLGRSIVANAITFLGRDMTFQLISAYREKA
ncbi:solute carrier family 25 (mitochondrial carnitine/acylcarnitine transporter), member 20/29 [Angomonas deanei]|nr:solute carrier family 25 (mitochondrial carnitine/acylcarnitine transporter), member 20/29 [Angomonas deanei]|eukprot:EPY25295.1 solute carrier family 25 (mitochondrial carnitine/acylcarnitine transporter), member 20/29 [Angomonas deanei]